MLALSNVSNVKFLFFKSHKMRPGVDMLQVADMKNRALGGDLARLRVN